MRPVLLSALLLLVAAPLNSCFSKSEKTGAELHLAWPLGQSVSTLDPALITNDAEAREVAYVYEPLYQYHYEKRPYQTIPAVAASAPEVHADGKRVRIRIKAKVFFQSDASFKALPGNRRLVTASDFVYAWKRVLEAKRSTLAYFFLSHWVREFKALDDRTLEINLNQPVARLTEYLALPALSAVPREAVEKYGADFGRHPVGTGAFTLADAKWGWSLVWERNEVYHEPGLPLVRRVVSKAYDDGADMKRDFLAGRLDVLPVRLDDLAEFVTPAKDLAAPLREKGITLVKGNGFDITFLAFNFGQAAFQNGRELRQALSLAVDPNAFNDLFWRGSAVVAQSPIAPPMDEYDPGYVSVGRKYDLAKAKTLLRKSGFIQTDGKPALTLVVGKDPGSLQLGEFFRRSFESLGLTLEVKPLTSGEESISSSLTSLAWTSEMPSAEGVLALLYAGNGGGRLNPGNYSSSIYDRAYRRLVSASTKDRRSAATELVKLVEQDVPWILGVHRIHFRLVQPWVKNRVHHDFDYGAVKYYGKSSTD